MARMKRLPSAKHLRACFTYNRITGTLRWKKRPRAHFATTQVWKIWNARFSGKIAGKKSLKYRCDVCLDYRVYRGHRIIWKMVTGKEPPPTIDHKNLNFRNNKWDNLRAATETEQRWNMRLRRNKSGYRGVSKNPRCQSRWWARIRIGKKPIYIGSFSTAKEASAAFEATARKVHGKFYRVPRR